ncbi:hypothetical protein ACFXO7_24215, partial [Nocardia tengchongensis]|uniref:hypothetical protein n=1 Tax=Nocardia tengchongensis TaxID=2055889 RepID=UPI003691D687
MVMMADQRRRDPLFFNMHSSIVAKYLERLARPGAHPGRRPEKHRVYEERGREQGRRSLLCRA